MSVPQTPAAAAGLPAVTAPDTVRTNLWLTEALMGEIVASAATALPAAPGSVRLVARREDPRNDMFQAVVTTRLAQAGYDLYRAGADSLPVSAVDHVFSFDVQSIDLNYPQVGRTLGIWRNWVQRELTVSVLVEVSEEATGRLLLNERIERRFGDRVGSDDFARVDSEAYDFTTAETSASGWQNRAEEIVVLGTLAGLVAIYFANTGN
jgi:hypothetical protein